MVGTANGGVARLSDHAPPFRRYQRRPGTGGPFDPEYVFTAFEDSRGEVWAGTMGAINHIDLKTGRYTVQPLGDNTEVSAITQDRSGQFWIGTIGGSLFRFNPATRRSAVYGQGTAGSPGCGNNNEVRALFVDHLGMLWAGARDSLCSFDPATNRFRAHTAGRRRRCRNKRHRRGYGRDIVDRVQEWRRAALRSRDGQVHNLPAFRRGGQPEQ